MVANISDCSCILNNHIGHRQENLLNATRYKHVYVDPINIFDEFGFSVNDYWPNVGCMIALSVGFRTMAYFILAFKYRNANR